MKLYGREWSRRELEARAGRPEQLFGVRRYRLQGGFEEGVEQIEVRSGSGLRYLVTPARGMDISHAEYAGTPLCWHAPNGDVHPAFYREEGASWLRTAAGGLMMTCGYRQVGSPCEDDGESFGAHGRAHQLPAQSVYAGLSRIDGDDSEICVKGELKESCLFGENLEITRRFCTRVGENSIAMETVIRNAGFRKEPLMALYHFNFGFPLIDEHTQFEFPSHTVEPRETETPLDGFDRWQRPDPDYRERVYYHSDLKETCASDLGRPMTSVRIRNPQFPIGIRTEDITVELSWSVDTLPRLVQWKMPGAGAHVMGIEPSNCWVSGRADERSRGTLHYLEPGERASHLVELRILMNES